MNDRALKQIEKWSWGGMILAVIASLFFKQATLPLSIIIGFSFTMANYWLLKRLLSNAFRKASSRGKVIFLLVIKYVVLLALLGGVVINFNLHLLGLLIGVSCLVVSIISVAVKEALLR